MLSVVELINKMETNNENQKLIIVNSEENWIRPLCKFFNLFVLSRGKICQIQKKNLKSEKVIFDITNVKEIHMINDNNINFYRINQNLLMLLTTNIFKYNMILNINENFNMFIYYVQSSLDDNLFKKFMKYDKRNLKKLLFSKKINFKNNNIECPICYEKLTEQNIIKTNCEHYFCKNCISKLEILKCPMCRQKITKLFTSIFVSNIINEMKKKIEILNKDVLIITSDLRIKHVFNNKKITFQKYNKYWNTNNIVDVFFFDCCYGAFHKLCYFPLNGETNEKCNYYFFV
jgi:hypothetical protein